MAARLDLKSKTHCQRGHELTPENVYVQPSRPNRKWACRSCRICQAERKVQYRKDNPQRVAQWKKKCWTKKLYGLSLEDVETKWQTQNSKCAICKMSLQRDSSTHIDHDHETNKVRDLLCASCNHGLGHFKESPEFLRDAADYLERHKHA